jgi:hypothetical protein
MDGVVILKTKALPCSRSQLHSALMMSLWYIEYHGPPPDITWLALNDKAYKKLKET